MKKIAITGGIGSGKSTVCRFFSYLGVPVYDSDSRAKALMNTSGRIIETITTTFGSECYGQQGLNRQFLSEHVFKNPDALRQLNAIVHPAVQSDFEQWTAGHKNCPYVLFESAIVLEIGWGGLFDKVIAVSAPTDIRIARVMRRDGATETQVADRIAHQSSDAFREASADYVICCDDRHLLIPQVLSIHEQLKRL